MLDDLGINLKPARALGMRTIKVTDADEAVGEVRALLELPTDLAQTKRATVAPVTIM